VSVYDQLRVNVEGMILFIIFAFSRSYISFIIIKYYIDMKNNSLERKTLSYEGLNTNELFC